VNALTQEQRDDLLAVMVRQPAPQAFLIGYIDGTTRDGLLTAEQKVTRVREVIELYEEAREKRR
jgi:hypothetical protein